MAKVRMKETPGGWIQVMNSTGVTGFTRRKCQEIIAEAIRIYEAQAKHTKAPTHPEYVHSFDIEQVAGGRFFGKKFLVVNHDEVANLVEFGAHPGGGTTFTLRYRPLGRAIEILSIE